MPLPNYEKEYNKLKNIEEIETVEFEGNSNILDATPVVYYKNGLMYVHAELKSGIVGNNLLLLKFSHFKAIGSDVGLNFNRFVAPLNCFSGCQGEVRIAPNAREMWLDISSSGGCAKIFIVFPAVRI